VKAVSGAAQQERINIRNWANKAALLAKKIELASASTFTEAALDN
jgi:hypothetical protein